MRLFASARPASFLPRPLLLAGLLLASCSPQPQGSDTAGTAGTDAASSAAAPGTPPRPTTSTLLGVPIPGATGQPLPNEAQLVADAQALVVSRGLGCGQHEIFALKNGEETLSQLQATWQSTGAQYRELVRFERGRLFGVTPPPGQGTTAVHALINASALFWCAAQ